MLTVGWVGLGQTSLVELGPAKVSVIFLTHLFSFPLTSTHFAFSTLGSLLGKGTKMRSANWWGKAPGDNGRVRNWAFAKCVCIHGGVFKML